MKRRQRGTGTIEEVKTTRADGSEVVRFRPRLSTPERRRSLGFEASREAADTVLEGARALLLADEITPGLTLGTWGTRFLNRRELEGYRAIADDRRRWAGHVASDPIAGLLLAKVTRRDVIEWLDRVCAKQAADKRRRRKLGKSTVQNILNLLRAAFGAAVERQVIESNPAADVKVPRRIAPTEEPWTYLTLDEQRGLWACAEIPKHHKLWMQFATGTGLREGEQFNLELRDLRTTGEDPEVTVRYGSKKAGPKSTRGKLKIRHVPLFGLGLEAARAWLAMLPTYCPKNPHGLVFPGPTGARKQKGKHMHFTRRERDPVTGKAGKPVPFDPLPGYLEAAGIIIAKRHDRRPIRWHDLRHTCAASLVSGLWGRRWSLEEVKGLLGHEAVATTERYAHLAKSALKAAAAETSGAGDKPTRKPTRARSRRAESSAKGSESSRSHLRDLNSRPTVYEVSPLANDLGTLDASKAQKWAHEALREIGRRAPRR